MQRIRKIFISALMALLLVTLTISAVFFLPSKSAFAMTETSVINIGKNGELSELVPNGLVDKDVLNNLFDKLAGTSSATLDDVKAKANLGADENGADNIYAGYSSYQLREQNGGDLIVKFGGLEWTVVYLSLDRNLNPVATLWLKNSSSLGSLYQKSSFSSMVAGGQFSNQVINPRSRYSTSTIRSNLNLGTLYATTNNEEAISTYSQDSHHPLAAFTMSDEQLKGTSTKSLMKYIDMPYLIPYQETESWFYNFYYGRGHTQMNINLTNEAYGLIDNRNIACTWGNAKTRNDRYFNIQNGSNFDYNTYVLNNYIVDATSRGSKITSGNNPVTASYSNMDLSTIGLYDNGKWKTTEEWTPEQLEEMRSWTDAESWAFDPVWLPSRSEPGCESVLTDKPMEGIWRCSSNQRSNEGGDYWMRSGYNSDVNKACFLMASGALSTTDAVDAGTEYQVRPAIHINLATLNRDSTVIVPAPSDITVEYSGKANSINEAKWYDSVLYSSGIKVTYDPADTIKAGVYDITLEIEDDGKAWSNAKDTSDKTRKIKMTVNPAKITVNIPTSGTGTAFRKDIQIAYHVDLKGSTELLRFPDSELTDSKQYIQLLSSATASDKESFKISYFITTHAESDHDEGRIKRETPDEKSDSWKEFDADNPDDMFKMQDKPLGYCVYYKITANNHTTVIDHFSVHVATETLTIETSKNELANEQYGYTIADQDALHTLVDEVVNAIKDQNNEPRKDELMTDENKAKFKLYFTATHDGSGDRYEANGSRYNVGKYYLQAVYRPTTGSESDYIHFKWNDGSEANHPYVQITPYEVTVINWKGNPQWGDDGATVKEKASASVQEQMLDEFNWVYDGKTMPSLTASIDGVDGSAIQLTVEISSPSVNVGTYRATASTTNENYSLPHDATKEFYIRKAANKWVNQYSCDGWSMGGGDAAAEHFASADYGEVVYEYHKDTADGTKIAKDQLYKYAEDVEELKIVVVYKVEGNTNFDGLSEQTAEFIIRQCAHRGLIGVTEYEQGDDNAHYRTCPDCGLKVNEAHSFVQQKNDSQHWQQCEVCNKAKDYVNHDYTIPGRIIKAADCTTTGEQEFSCECGMTKAKSIPTIAHTYIKDDDGNDMWFHSEGEDEHKHWHTCSMCEQDYDIATCTQTEIPAKEPDCVTDGNTKGAKCEICGKIITPTQVRKKLGHKYDQDDVEELDAPTCEEPGRGTVQCQRPDCGQVFDVDIPATGHSYGEWHVKTAATCLLGGEDEHECSVCHAKETQPTDPKGHSYGEWQPLNAATCDTAGIDKRECTACHNIETQTVPALAHKGTMQYYPEQAATVDLEGEREHYHCTACGKNFADQNGVTPMASIVIPKLSPSSGSGASEWLSKNWLWIVLAIAAILLITSIIFIIIGIGRRRRERERDRQFETFMKMQMMQNYGGFNSPPTINVDPAALGGAQYALPPASQEVINAAVTAAIAALRADGTFTDPHAGNTSNMGNTNGANYANGYAGNMGGANGYASGASYAGNDLRATYSQPEPPQQPADQPAPSAQNAQYGQPNGQPTAQQYSQPSAQPFITPEPPQPQQQAAQSAQPQPQPSQPSQPVFTDNDGFYDSYKKPKYDDDDDEDD